MPDCQMAPSVEDVDGEGALRVRGRRDVAAVPTAIAVVAAVQHRAGLDLDLLLLAHGERDREVGRRRIVYLAVAPGCEVGPDRFLDASRQQRIDALGAGYTRQRPLLLTDQGEGAIRFEAGVRVEVRVGLDPRASRGEPSEKEDVGSAMAQGLPLDATLEV